MEKLEQLKKQLMMHINEEQKIIFDEFLANNSELVG